MVWGDLWTKGTSPPDDEVIVPQPAVFGPEEDYVLPSLPPQPQITNVTLYYGDDAVGSVGPPIGIDEVYAFNLKPPDLWFENVQVGMGTDEAVGILTEDYDVSGLGFGLIKPELQSYRRPWYEILDQNESAGGLAPFIADEWALNAVPPTRLEYWRHPLFSQDIEDVPFLTGMMEESYWLNPVPPVQQSYFRSIARHRSLPSRGQESRSPATACWERRASRCPWWNLADSAPCRMRIQMRMRAVRVSGRVRGLTSRPRRR